MRRFARTLTPAAALVLIAIAATPAQGEGPTAQAAYGCPLTYYQQRHLGTTYVYSLRVSGTRCRHGRKVVKAFNACRHERGRAGRCYRQIYDYTCRERRYNKSEFSYDARVRCKKTGREIFWKYTQNL